MKPRQEPCEVWTWTGLVHPHYNMLLIRAKDDVYSLTFSGILSKLDAVTFQSLGLSEDCGWRRLT